MAPVVITGTLQIKIEWSLAGTELGSNVVHAIIGSAPTVDQTMANTIAGLASAAHVSSGLNALQPTTVTLSGVSIRDIRTANNPLIEGAVSSPGTATGDLLPRGNALVVTHRTAKAGRSYRGRTYVPGFAESATDPVGRATTAAQTAAQEFLTDFDSAMSAQGWGLGVASQKLALSTDITAFVTRNGVWDRQWRRATRRVFA